MRFLACLICVALFGGALHAHPFDDRADMTMQLILVRDDQGAESMRMVLQYRYLGIFGSYVEILELDKDKDQRITREERDLRFRELAADIQKAAVLNIRGERVELDPDYSEFVFVNLANPDQSVDDDGGMPALEVRIGYSFAFDVRLPAALGPGTHGVEFHFAERRMDITDPREQLQVWDDRSGARRPIYPIYERTSEKFERISFVWETGDVIAAAPPPATKTGAAEQLIELDKQRHDPDSTDSKIMQAFQQLRDVNAGLGVWLAVLLLMFGWGAAHAVQPGHGKALVASYLISTRGTKADALFLGVVVTAAHTSGVMLLMGGAWAASVLWPGTLRNPEQQLAEWITLAVGATILLMGVGLVLKRTGGGHHKHDIFGRHIDPADDHHHDHDHGHHHHHDHDHDHHHHDHGHHHHHHDKSPEDSDILVPVADHHHGRDPARMSRFEILGLGILGGIIPCPTAFVIGLIAFQQQWYLAGLIMVLVFSLGLAAVLSSIGLVMVQSKTYLKHRAEGEKGRMYRLVEDKLPVFGALVITLIGLTLSLFALVRLDILDPNTFMV